VKLTVRQTYVGDRLCFPEVIPDRLIDGQAAYAQQLDRSGVHRKDAIARSQRAIPSDLPALLQADPDLMAGYVRFCDISARDISTLDNRRMDRGELRGEIDGLGVIANTVVGAT
jgi:hypothetical protein